MTDNCVLFLFLNLFPFHCFLVGLQPEDVVDAIRTYVRARKETSTIAVAITDYEVRFDSPARDALAHYRDRRVGAYDSAYFSLFPAVS